MPRVNPFLERAGFRAFAPRVPVAHVELLEAFSLVGIEEDNLVDPALVQQRLERLPPSAGEFLELHLQRFLKSHGRRRTMPPGLARTQYVLARLTYRPAYYLWVNPSHTADSGWRMCACGWKKALASNPPSAIRNPESLRRSL